MHILKLVIFDFHNCFVAEILADGGTGAFWAFLLVVGPLGSFQPDYLFGTHTK